METDFLRSACRLRMVGRGLRAIGNARFLGAALRIEAEAHSGLGNVERLAAHAIYESWSYLVDHPQPFALSRTYASAAHDRQSGLCSGRAGAEPGTTPELRGAAILWRDSGNFGSKRKGSARVKRWIGDRDQGPRGASARPRRFSLDSC